MKSTMKSVLSTLSLVAMLAGFSTNASAYVWVTSGDTGAGSVTVINGLSVFIGGLGVANVTGTTGAGTTVMGGGSQTVYFDTDLVTNDKEANDQFIVTISTLGYYWTLNSALVNATNTAQWTWGGLTVGGTETNISAPLPGGYALTLNSGADALYYISFSLKTDNVNNSWGSYHVLVPEPSMLALFGIGLLGAGVAGSRRKNIRA